MEHPHFEGFSPKALEFLQEWQQNNSRDWFQPRKTEYEEWIKHPALDFIFELGSRLKLISPEIQFDLRHNGSLLRIYRDTRFSADKTPYHPNVRAVFWQGPGKKSETPGFFVRLDHRGADVFAGIHHFNKPQLQAFREAVDSKTQGSELERILDGLSKAGPYGIGEKTYKRVPRGYDPDHPRAELLKFGGLYSMLRDIPQKTVLSPELVDVCFEHFHNMSPVQQWLVQAFYA